MTTDNVNADNSALIVTPDETPVLLPPSPSLEEIDNHLETIAQEIAHLRLSLLTETESSQQTVKHLRHRLNLLTFGFFIAILTLVGGGTWLFSSPTAFEFLRKPTASLPSEESRIGKLERQINAGQGENSQLLAIEVKALQEKIQILEANQKAVQELDTKVETLVTNTNTRQQTIKTLATALQDVINVETSNVPSASGTAESTPDTSNPSENQSESEVSSPTPTPTTLESEPSPQPKPSPTSKPSN